MDGSTGFKRDNNNKKIIKTYKGEEIVERYKDTAYRRQRIKYDCNVSNIL